MRALLTVEQIQNLLDAAILTAKTVGEGKLELARQAKLAEQSNMDAELALRAENESLKSTVADLQQQNLVISAAMEAKDGEFNRRMQRVEAMMALSDEQSKPSMRCDSRA